MRTAKFPRISNGIILNPDLPYPVANLDYTPKILNSKNQNIANSQVNGYVGEMNLTNDVAALPDQTAIKYDDTIGSHGADVASGNSTTGEVTLWYNKFRSSSKNPIIEHVTRHNQMHCLRPQTMPTNKLQTQP